MFSITLITMGKLKEKFYISAAEEYKKRLGGYCAFTLLELPEARLPENPSPGEIGGFPSFHGGDDLPPPSGSHHGSGTALPGGSHSSGEQVS